MFRKRNGILIQFYQSALRDGVLFLSLVSDLGLDDSLTGSHHVDGLNNEHQNV